MRVFSSDVEVFLKTARKLFAFFDRDGRNYPPTTAILQAARIRDLPVVPHLLHTEDDMYAEPHTFVRYLQEQPIGTRFYVCARTEPAKTVMDLFAQIPLTTEVVMHIPIGTQRHPVFCMGCYHRNPATNEDLIQCERCGRQLSVTMHYSPRLDAVMGSLTLPR